MRLALRDLVSGLPCPGGAGCEGGWVCVIVDDVAAAREMDGSCMGEDRNEVPRDRASESESLSDSSSDEEGSELSELALLLELELELDSESELELGLDPELELPSTCATSSDFIGASLWTSAGVGAGGREGVEGRRGGLECLDFLETDADPARDAGAADRLRVTS